MLFDSPAPFPLPRLSSSSTIAGPVQTTPPHPPSRFTFDLPSPQLDPAGLERHWMGGGRGGAGAGPQHELALAPPSPALALGVQLGADPSLRHRSGPGTAAIDTSRVFGPGGKNGLLAKGKKPSVKAPQASHLVAHLARRGSSSTSTSSARALPVLDPAFLSNPFFSPFADTPPTLSAFPPASRRASSRLSFATTSPGRFNLDGGTSSPLQPPTPTFHPPPPTPLLKRRISIPLPRASAAGGYPTAQAQTPAGGQTQTSLSATRTRLRGDEDGWSTLRRLDGVKRRRLLLAGSALEQEEQELEPAQDGHRPLPPATDTDLADRRPSAATRPRIVLRLPKAVAQVAPSPDAIAHRASVGLHPDERPTLTRRRRISVSSSVSSLSDDDSEATAPSLSARPAPAPAPLPASAPSRPRVRAPAPTQPLATTTQTRSRRLFAGSLASPSVLAPDPTLSKGSSLSPSVSRTEDDEDAAEPSQAPPLAGPGSLSRSSSPLSNLSSVGDSSDHAAPPSPVLAPTLPIVEAGRRTFPGEVDMTRADEFPAWYRRFRLSRTLSPTLADALQLPHAVAPTGARSAGARLADLRPQGPADLYAPRWIKGIGGDKMGVCPVCVEDGEGIEWLKTKVSQYNFHLLYAHGISPTTGLPFSPPLRFRHSPRVQSRPDEKTSLCEGLCHECRQWVAVEGIKAVEVRVKEIFWWKHAKSCHRSSRIAGDTDIFAPSPLLTRLTNYVDSLPAEDKLGWIVPSEHTPLGAGDAHD